LVGSVSFAIVVSKIFRLADPRTFGSGNPGATNVLRTGNKAAAALTLLGDCVKGVVPVALAVYFDERLALGDAGIALVSVAVFAGHLWPLFFRFKGTGCFTGAESDTGVGDAVDLDRDRLCVPVLVIGSIDLGTIRAVLLHAAIWIESDRLCRRSDERTVNLATPKQYR
jgi:hypothetical protein